MTQQVNKVAVLLPSLSNTNETASPSSSALSVTESSLAAHLRTFETLACSARAGRRVQRPATSGAEEEERGMLDTHHRQAQADASVTTELIKALGLHVQRYERDVRRVHGLGKKTAKETARVAVRIPE
jgi:hypothetical protein